MALCSLSLSLRCFPFAIVKLGDSNNLRTFIIYFHFPKSWRRNKNRTIRKWKTIAFLTISLDANTFYRYGRYSHTHLNWNFESTNQIQAHRIRNKKKRPERNRRQMRSFCSIAFNGNGSYWRTLDMKLVQFLFVIWFIGGGIRFFSHSIRFSILHSTCYLQRACCFFSCTLWIVGDVSMRCAIHLTSYNLWVCVMVFQNFSTILSIRAFLLHNALQLKIQNSHC